MKTERINENTYVIRPKIKKKKFRHELMDFEMKVPAKIYANSYLMDLISDDKTLDQISNVACLPGVKKHVVALSDAHQGYGFCIGGVAATAIDGGAITPGGVGYDINCGVRLLRTPLSHDDVKSDIPKILDSIFRQVPSGLGSKGKLNVSKSDFNRILETGIDWAIDHGYGFDKDRLHCEDNGHTEGADSSVVSNKAKSRGISQIGSLGSGNHFLEIQRVDEIFDDEIANKLNIKKNQVTVMIHTGSRAFGHQVCTDAVHDVERLMNQKNLPVPDRQLAYAESGSKEAEKYLAQMRAAANFGWTNRHMAMHYVRKGISDVIDVRPENIDLVYGVAHNILKVEEHDVGNGKREKVNVHRKGATRAFPPNHPLVPEEYKTIGQPALIPGTMGTASYLCVGQESALDLSFGSCPHGGGRRMSRTQAKKKWNGKNLKQKLKAQGIYVKSDSLKVLAEEASGAYKDIDQVVQVSHDLGIVKKVARFVPIGVVKG